MQVDLLEFDRLMREFEREIYKSGKNADQRFRLFRENDPFPNIPPALLNAGHLASYALTTGMISPFERSQLTKPATYLVKVEGECRYRDDDGKLVSFYLSNDPSMRARHVDVRNKVRLGPNSVCFLTLAPEFRMPAYIGARFNLLIRDVYRGLLVGTGPLVDPGFSGRLSIPIHNFTNREYFIDAGEGLVYFEFTKLTGTNGTSPPTIPPWVPTPLDAQPPFPASKANRRTLDDYLNAATGSGPPESAIGQALHKTRKLVEDGRRLLTISSVAGIVAALGLFYSAWSVYVGAQQFTASAQTELKEGRDKIFNELASLRARQEEVEKLLKAIQGAAAARVTNLPFGEAVAPQSSPSSLPSGSTYRPESGPNAKSR